MPVMAVNNQNQHESAGDYRSRPRRSAGKKMEAVLRLLRRGEDGYVPTHRGADNDVRVEVTVQASLCSAASVPYVGAPLAADHGSYAGPCC
jgi:hypothetical protein